MKLENGLPHLICQNCVDLIVSFYAFKKRILENEEKFKREKILNCTVQTETIEKRHATATQCEVCGKMLSCYGNLVKHMKLHTGERPYSCDTCKRTFSRAEHLNIHKRTHTGLYLKMEKLENFGKITCH